jgi:hypothetical protein
MFTSKTTVVTGKMSKTLSKSVDDLMGKGSEMLDKGMEMLDAGMKVMDEAFKETDTSANVKVSSTIRVRLTQAQLQQLKMGASLSFQAGGTTIRLEPAE